MMSRYEEKKKKWEEEESLTEITGFAATVAVTLHGQNLGFLESGPEGRVRHHGMLDQELTHRLQESELLA